MKYLFALTGSILFFLSSAQTLFWQDNFENASIPDLGGGIRTPENNSGSGGPPFTAYFCRTTGASISQQIPFSGFANTNYWAGEDHDTPFATQPEQQIDWSGINISGKSGLSFRALFAANNTNASFDGPSTGGPPTDYVILEYSVDGGPYLPLIRFFPDDIIGSKTLKEDTNGDGIGEGTSITNAFTEFFKLIPATGTTMSIRLRVLSNALNEEWGIDNIRLFEVVACPSVTVTPNIVTNVSCAGGNNGTASVNVSGGSGFVYNWTPGNPTGDGTASVTNLTSGLYTCTVTNSCGNSGSTNIPISEPSPIVLNGSQSNLSCNAVCNGSAMVSASGGTGTYTYLWPHSGSTASMASGLCFGSYTVNVTDGNGCTASQMFNITQPSAINITPTSEADITCYGANNGSASVSASGGTGLLTYNWNPGNPSGDGSNSVTGLSPGTWSCTVTDANMCSASINFNITQPSVQLDINAFAQTNNSCSYTSNGSAQITNPTGGTGPYTLDWTPGNPIGDGSISVSGLTAGTWVAHVTDANGCKDSVLFNITSPMAINITPNSQINVSCNGGNNGSASVSIVGGTGTLAINWTPGNPTGDGTNSVTGLTAGVWQCNVTDANGCTDVESITVSQPPAITISLSSSGDVSCAGGNNGFASITSSGGIGSHSYNWSPGNPTGDGTNSVSGLTAGLWSCTITDMNGCSNSIGVNISSPPALTVSQGFSYNLVCNGDNTGVANVSVSGGTGSYSYDWTPGNPQGEGTPTAYGLSAGSWTCSVTDGNGCMNSETFILTEPFPLTVSVATLTPPSMYNACDGAVSILASGGDPAYLYQWTPGGQVTDSISGLCDGTYYITVTDNNGCSNTISINMMQPAPVSVYAVSQNNVSCFGGSDGFASVTASGGVGGYSYNWTPGNPPGDGTADATGLTAGTWMCTVTDANGATNEYTFIINEPAPISSSQSMTICFGESIMVGNNTYSSSGNYSDILVASNGCDSTINTFLTVLPENSSTQNITLCSGETILIGSNIYSSSGNYSDTIPASNGCDSIITTQLTVLPPVDITVTVSGITLAANNTSGSYQWIDCVSGNNMSGENDQSFTPTQNGNYAVIIDENGCSDTSACFNVSVNSLMENLQISNLNVYPNPIQSIVHVTSEEAFFKIRVVNSVGKEVNSVIKMMKECDLDLEKLPSGIYFLHVEYESAILVRKIVKQ